MARSALQDPLDKFRWIVSIDDFTRSGFTSCGVPSYKITTHDYPEGGAHLNPRNIPNSVSYTPVTLTRGVTNDTSFNKWANGAFDLVQNMAATQESGLLDRTGILGPSAVRSSDEYPFQYRRTVKIKHVNRVGQTVVQYTLYNAFPIEYKPASDFDANADDGLSIETLVLGYEGFDVTYPGLTGTAASLIAGNLF